MADLKISALNSLAGADLVAADVVAVVDDSASETKKLTVSDLIANGVTLISDSTIPSAKILFSAGSVDTAELAASAVETAKINDSAVTAAKLADNSSVTLVSTLPGSGDFVGQVALDTDDSKLYVWSGSAWTSVKGAGSINVVNGSTSGIVNITTSTSGDTVTVSTTLDDTTAAAQFLAGPTGAAGTVGYRAIIGTDLPAATTTTKGAVIVNGEGLRMDSNTIEIDNDLTANTSTFQAVKFDSKGLITSGRDITSADLPNATNGATGAVKPGTGLEMGSSGAIDHSNSVTGATKTKITFDAQGHVTAGTDLAASDIPDLDTAKITTGTFPTARIADDAVTAAKLGDRSTATIAETTPAGGAFIGQTHLNSITGDYFLWDGNVWQPIGISVGEIVLAGTYNASTNLVATVTSEGTAVGYEVGSALPAASSSNKGHYVIVSEAGTGTSPAPTVALNPPDFLLSTGTAYTEIDVSDTVTAQQASNIQFTAAGNIAATNVQAALEELDTEKAGLASPAFTGTVALGEDAVITFEGATDNAFETTLTVVDPTADRSLSLPNISGTLISSGDTGTVTSTMILDGTIANADISNSAEIAVSKLANGSARQLLQTASNGTDVEFTSNVDVPGTFDCTGAGTFDSTLTVTGLISADGKVKFPAGTASAPSFYFGTDTNTGLYHSAADEVAITTGGTQRVVVDSSGNVGIGVASPSQKLHIQGTGTTRMQITGGSSATARINFGDTDDPDIGMIIYDNANNSLQFVTNVQERLRIDQYGRVLVGTTSAGNGSADDLTIANSGQTGITIRSGTTSGGHIYFSDGTSGADQERGIISYQHGGNYMRFYTDATERLRITSDGKVGIGESSPSETLHVKGGTVCKLTLESNSSTGTSGVQFGDPEDDNVGRIQYEHNGNYMQFEVNASEAFRVDSSGRLLLGTTSASPANSYSDNLVVSEAAANAGISIHGNNSNSNYASLYFGDAGSAQRSYLEAQLGSNGNFTVGTTGTGPIRFTNSSGELARIDGSGRLLVGTTVAYGSNDNVVIQKTNAAARIGLQHSTTGEVTAGNELGILTFYSNDGDLNPSATIIAAADLDHGAGDKPGRLVFSTTADGASSPTERLRITSTGAWAIEGASNYGTSGQVLTSNGNDSPTWQDAGGGGGAWNLVATINASNATTATFDGNIDNTYKQYAIVITNLVGTSSSMADLRVRFVAGGTEITSSQYDSRGRGYFFNQASINDINAVNENYGQLTNGGFRSTYTDAYAQGIVWMVGDRNSKSHGLRSEFNCVMTQDSSRNFISYVQHFESTTARTVDGLQFFMESGNLTGTFKLYGLS